MKKNIFGLPVFSGKVLPSAEFDKVFSIKCVGNCWLTFKNDLSSISATNKECSVVEGFTTEFERDNDMALSLMNLAAIACRVKPENMTEEQINDFMMYVCTGSKDISPLSSLRKNLETEVVMVNGFGFSANTNK